MSSCAIDDFILGPSVTDRNPVLGDERRLSSPFPSKRDSCRHRPGKRLRMFNDAGFVRQTGELKVIYTLNPISFLSPFHTGSLLRLPPPAQRTRNRSDVLPFPPLTVPRCLNKATANSPRKTHKALW